MKRFAFRLARLQRVRDVARQAARVQLAGALTALDQARREHAARAEERDMSMEWDGSQSGATDSELLKQIEAWRADRQLAVDLAEADEAVAAARAQDALERHAIASREHRVLERLREKRREDWFREAEIEERKFLDEVHLQRLARHEGIRRAEEETCEG